MSRALGSDRLKHQTGFTKLMREVGRRLGRNPPSVLGDIHLNGPNISLSNTTSYDKSVNPLEPLDELSKFCRVGLQLAKETIEHCKGIMRFFFRWVPNDLRQPTIKLATPTSITLHSTHH